MGMGQNIIFGVMKIVNFCHGEMLMVGMYLTFVFYTYGGIDPYMALPRLISFGVLIVVTVALFTFLKYSTMGKQIRAVSQNPVGAEVVGINVKRIYLLTYGLGISLAGIAGVLLTQFYTIFPTAGAAIGINPTKYKVMAVVISAMIAGLVGFFYACYVRYIDPEMMIMSKSTEAVLPAIVGGAAFVEGPIVGGLIMIPLAELLRANYSAILPGINMIIYAIALLVIIRFRPAGILGWYTHSGVKTFFDKKILRKPDMSVFEEVESMQYQKKEEK